MTTLEIILLIAGAVIFILGYAIPARSTGSDDGGSAVTDEDIHESVNREVEASRGRLEGIVDETIDYAMDKTERSLERVTNDKMMALSDYSNTIMDDINKNHKEVLFMYDMLHDKHENLKSTVSEASKAEKKVKEATREAQEASDVQEVKDAHDNSENHVMSDISDHIMTDDETFVPFIPKQVRVETDENTDSENTDTEPVVFKPVTEEKKASKKKNVQPRKGSEKNIVSGQASGAGRSAANAESGKEPAIQFAQGMQSRNNNEKILQLHSEGRSNTAIAKELGLGIGEVKLVIDLYENK